MKATEIERDLKNILRSEVSSGYITKEEMKIELTAFRNWLSNAGIGDIYNYDMYEFIYGPEYD